MPREERFSSRTFASFICLGFLLLLLPVRLAYGQTDPPRDQAQAWKWMQETMKHTGFSRLKMENWVVSGDFKSAPFNSIHLSVVTSITQPFSPTPLANNFPVVQWYEFPNLSSGQGGVRWDWTWSPRGAWNDAQKFQSALVFLARQAQDEQAAKDAADLEAFKPKAAAWRQLAVKPQAPVEALRHQVLAEYAYKQKDVPKAITEYSEALRIFPYWPAGQNNLAFLAGEVGTRPGYNVAIYHMKMYLELAPNAPDAQAAQDSIFVWEDKRTTATP
jgi:hypothetical protein